MSVRAPVAPSVLRWARTTAGLSVDDAAGKLNVSPERIEEWEDGRGKPTINQLRIVAEKYRRPFGTFLMREPPEEDALPHDFRHLPGEVPAPTGALLRSHIRFARQRRIQALELYEELGEDPPIFDVRAMIGEDPEVVGSRIRRALKVTLQEQATWRKPELALARWKEHLERSGILVFQFSRIEVSEMRGLSIAEFPLPVIVANSKDAAAGRIFTLFHELAHVALRSSGLCDLDDEKRDIPEEDRVEVFCNKVAGAALVPARELQNHPSVANAPQGVREWHDYELDQIKRTFAVSRFVILRRLVRLGRASDDFYRERHRVWMAELERLKLTVQSKDTIIPPYRKSLAATGKQFARVVFRAYYEDRITLNDVSEYLGLKVRHLPLVEREVFR